MKKFLCFFILSMIIFCSCNSPDKEQYKGGYSADFEMQYRAYTLKGELRREKSGIYQITLNHPDDLKDLKIISESNNTMIIYDDIILNAEQHSGIEASFCISLFNVLDKIAYSSDKCTVSKNKIEGKTEDGRFEVILKNKKIESVNVPDLQLSMVLENFEFLE